MEKTALPRDWPHGRSLAVSVSIMLEGWTEEAAPGIGPMGNPLKAGVLDRQARSWAEYGPKTGAWRLLEILEAAKVSAVFYTSGILAERYPELLAAISGAGHAVAAHAWGQNIVPAYQTREEEARDLARSIAAIEKSAGAAPRGWISPRCTPSAATAELLAGAGFEWHADYFDADLPYRVTTPAGALIAVPFTTEVNDMPLYIRYGNEPEAFTRILDRLLRGWPSLGGRAGTIDITAHAHVFGRPAGALEFREALALVRRHEERAWLTNHRDLATLFARG